MFMRLASISQRSALIIGVIAGLFYYAFGFDDGSKIKAQLNKAKDALVKEQSLQVQSEEAIQQADKIKAALNQLSEQYKQVSQELPTEIQISEILKSFDSISEITGVTIKSKEQGRPLFKEKDNLEIFPLSLIAEGSYSGITQFLYYLSTLERIVRIKNIKVSNDDTNSNNEYKGKITLRAEVLSFRLAADKAGNKQ